MVSDSNKEIDSMGTPWLVTLKNPNSSQAFTMRVFASGLERSTKGIVVSVENVVVLQFLIQGYCSVVVGLDNTTIVNE